MKKRIERALRKLIKKEYASLDGKSYLRIDSIKYDYDEETLVTIKGQYGVLSDGIAANSWYQDFELVVNKKKATSRFLQGMLYQHIFEVDGQ